MLIVQNWPESNVCKPVAKPRIARLWAGEATLVNATLPKPNPNKLNILRLSHLIASPPDGLAMRGGFRPWFRAGALFEWQQQANTAWVKIRARW